MTPCPLLCSDPVQAADPILKITVADDRILAACPECSRVLTPDRRAIPTRFYGHRAHGEAIVYMTYAEGSSAPLLIQRGGKLTNNHRDNSAYHYSS